MSEQLTELQTHLAFQEQSISELNEVITDQQKQIDMLRLELKLLKEKFEELEFQQQSGVGDPQAEKPPHY